ncbi:VOC family protein [Paracoccaceae bacterium GXU_MW_L88]
MASSDAPISIGHVTLTVNDLDRVGDFYTRVLGLEPLTRDGETAQFGADGRLLVALEKDAAARHHPYEAGLFHTAFLLPSRAALGGWLTHARDLGLRLDGASDHLVSEALYLRDPEGNGIEIYWDRPRSEWQVSGDEIAMNTLPLDLMALAEAATPWNAAPSGTVIGHVHLQVGDVAAMDSFATETLGATKTFGMAAAGWYGWGGYHHHIAGNVWNSRGAETRSADSRGLKEVGLIATDPAGLPDTLTDPWGTRFTLSNQPA